MNKTYIYKKVKNLVRRTSCVMLLSLSTLFLGSCMDTIILPDDKTVDEDFWQTKSDVSSMVNAAYMAMASNDAIARFIVWGDFRSDEIVLANSPAGTATYDALNEMAAVNMQTTNTFASWAAIYAVINRCNIVLDRAGEVRNIDPNYTEGDYQTDRSQMLALRALCYFYLVRNYRDVPYITEAYMNSSQNMQVPQSSPAYVLGQCIADLEEASKNAVQARGFSTSEWQRVGWLTNDGINALLADIYLWRASVTHNADDYQRCVDYCDLVINSKKSQHVKGRNEVAEKEYPLADANQVYSSLFVSQNAEESIFELQSRSNLSVCQYYFKYGSNSSSEGFLKAGAIFGNAASKVQNVQVSQVFSSNDLRYYAACYGVPGDGNLNIRKMISQNAVVAKTAQARETSINYGSLDRNYIVYSLTDVMLMKAEALVQQVDTSLAVAEKEELLRVPFTLVQAVNTRSLHADNLTDSMTWAGYKTTISKEQMELLVMQERLRELCFQGKRWYDLLRYSYRHVDGTAVAAKMQNEAYLYLPVPNSDIIVCPLLRQNPVYKSMSDFEKSY